MKSKHQEVTIKKYIKMFNKFKNIVNPINFILDKNSVNFLIKTITSEQYSSNKQNTILLEARLAYLSKYRYDRNISQAECIMLTNIISRDVKKTVREVPHLIYHTLEQESRLQVIPDEDIFNLRDRKYGDVVNVKTEKPIEFKTFTNLDTKNVDDLVRQYHLNKRNDKFIFSLFYRYPGDITEIEVKSKLIDQLNIREDQIVLKSFNNIKNHFTFISVEQAINYYNISWPEYQIENNARLLQYIDEVLLYSKLNTAQRRRIMHYKQILIDVNLNKKLKPNQIKYPYPNQKTMLLLENKEQTPSLDGIELTPEEIMEDQTVIDFNEEKEK